MDFFRVKTKEEPLPFMPDIPQIQPITRNDDTQIKLNLLQQLLAVYQKLLAILQHQPTLGVMRSGEWPALRKRFLAEHNACAVCITRKRLEVHHKKSLYLHGKAGELDENNLIVLCKFHHLWTGHLGSYYSENTDVEKDAIYLRSQLLNRP